MIIDLPPLQQEMVVCSIYAAKEYNIPTTALLAIAEAEGGKPGQWIKNKNGSYDIGTMQFNTNYLKELEKFGITTKDVEKSGCYPYHLAAWRINQHLRKDKGEFWTKIANYHSKTPNKNAIYKAKLIPLAAKWEAWLKSKFLSKNDNSNLTPPPKPRNLKNITVDQINISAYADYIEYAPIPKGIISDKFNINKNFQATKNNVNQNPMKSSSAITLPNKFIELMK